MYKLFLDDQLDDPNTPERWVPQNFLAAKSSAEAIQLVKDLGPPEFMSLDHDLGQEDNAMIFLKWLAKNINYPPDYIVHSQNPVGRQNIISFMESWKKSIHLS